mgnify:CR=1 FL=1
MSQQEIIEAIMTEVRHSLELPSLPAERFQAFAERVAARVGTGPVQSRCAAAPDQPGLVVHLGGNYFLVAKAKEFDLAMGPQEWLPPSAEDAAAVSELLTKPYTELAAKVKELADLGHDFGVLQDKAVGAEHAMAEKLHRAELDLAVEQKQREKAEHLLAGAIAGGYLDKATPGMLREAADKARADMAQWKERAEKAEALAASRLQSYNELEAGVAMALEAPSDDVVHWAKQVVADLRAARAEADALRADAKSANEEGAKFAAQAAAAVLETGALRAELEALKASPGVVAIAKERQRQISVEGWTPAHDDDHSDGGLEQAAACYADPCPPMHRYLGGETMIPDRWPWAPEWWKPKTRRRDLERAGALIAAGLDRLIRAAGAGVSDAG